MTQQELAEIGEVSRPRISRYETGADEPPFSFLRKVRSEARRRGHPFNADWFFEAPVQADAVDDQAAIAPETAP